MKIVHGMDLFSTSTEDEKEFASISDENDHSIQKEEKTVREWEKRTRTFEAISPCVILRVQMLVFCRHRGRARRWEGANIA